MRNRYNKQCKQTELYQWLRKHQPWILREPEAPMLLANIDWYPHIVLDYIREFMEPGSLALQEFDKQLPTFELEALLNCLSIGPCLTWSRCYAWSDALQDWTFRKTGLPVVQPTDPEWPALSLN